LYYYNDKNSMAPMQPQMPGSMGDMNPNDPYDPHAALPEALKVIANALMGETEDQLFYQFLMGEAPDDEEKDIIKGIRDNEMKHYKMFNQMYFELTGKQPSPPTEMKFEQPKSYCEGLQKALMGEQNAVVKYRKILFAMQNRRHINMITEIITDELRHLGLYNYLYAKNRCTA
jgi:rubrerythrin